jgi:hypothetical protein
VLILGLGLRRSGVPVGGVSSGPVPVDGRVVLELRPVGLEVSETLRVTLPNDRLVSRLGTAAE